MYDTKFIYELIKFGYLVPNLPMSDVRFLFFLFFEFCGQPDTQPPSQPAWPQRSQFGQARFGYIVPNWFINWTDSGVWCQICLWIGQIRIYSTKFTNESHFQSICFLLLGFCGRPDTQPPQPAWPQRSRLGQARFGHIITHLPTNWTDPRIWYKMYVWICQIQEYNAKFTNESNFYFIFY